MKVLVIGAGVAGPLVAVALKRAGHDVEIFDRVKPPAAATAEGSLPIWLPGDIGGGISMQGNSLRVLNRLGLYDELAEKSTRLEDMDMRTFSGRLIATFKMGKMDSFGSLDVLRSTLAKISTSALNKEGVNVVVGKRLVGVQQSSDGALGVTAHFEDGTSAQGDILIGADGIHSATRAAILPPGTIPVKSDFVGYIGISEHSPDIGFDSKALTFQLDNSSGRSTWIARSSDSRVLWCMFETKPGDIAQNDTWDSVEDLSAEKVRMTDMAKRWGLPDWFERMIAKSVRIMPVRFSYLEPLPSWHAGNCVLIGDAAHAMMPFVGQGAGTSIEDTEILAALLTKFPSDPRRAFALFEELQRPRVEKIAKTSVDMGKNMHSTSPVAGFIGRSILRFSAFVLNTTGVNLNSAGLPDHDTEKALNEFLKAKGL
ncbi:hypothetical protein HK405_004728 [Cladochytrium tenue]|nr:hypothetical protein HK405_004728 [Cladochytrium tenue]